MTERFEISSVDEAEVLRYLGYRGAAEAPEVRALLDWGCAHASEVGRPAATVRTFGVAGREPRADGTPQIQLEGSALALDGADIASHLDGAVSVAVVAVTVGMGVERELRRLAATDMARQLVFDAASTALVERAADVAEAGVVGRARAEGRFCASRFSPGYGDLPLACQPVLLASLDAQRTLGITLTDSLLMIPTKSVTAVVGLFDKAPERRVRGCASCNLFDVCSARRRGRTCDA